MTVKRFSWLPLLGLVLMAGAVAATQHTVTYTVSLYKGTSKVRDITGSSQDVARINCELFLAGQVIAGTYSCKTPVTTDVVTLVPDPPPPPAVFLQFTTAYPTAYKPLQGAIVSGKVNVALSDCSVTGYWTFSLDGTDVNSEGGCPFEFLGDGLYWDSMGVPNGSHTIKATGTVPIAATFTVTNVVVPLPPPAPVPTPGTGTATLKWTAPTQNTDGTVYADAFGFVIDYGQNLALLSQTIDVNDPKATTYLVTGLGSGVYYFCIHARNTSNLRSACSQIVSKTLP